MNSYSYLDYNATSPLEPQLKEEMARVIGSTLNPSSIHQGGQKSRALVEEARDYVSSLLGLKSGDKILFTSGATEANNTIILGSFLKNPSAKCTIVTTPIEHPSILEPCERLAKLGCEIAYLKPPFTSENMLTQIERHSWDKASLLSIMLANNETGEILPVKEVFNTLQKSGASVLIHSDAVQALGKMPLDFSTLGADFLSLSGHKIGAFSGVGAIVLRSGLEIEPLIMGGPQEKHQRAGTENVLGIISFGIAARLAKEELDDRIKHMFYHKEQFIGLLESKLGNAIVFTGKLNNSLPNTIHFRVPGVETQDLVVALDLKGVQVSAGAACASGKPGPSHVMMALGQSEEEANEYLRISFGTKHDEEEMKYAADQIFQCIRKQLDVS